MSFQSLKVDELKKVAASFAVEPEVADEEHGPTKKELLAALAENGVSWKDYQDLKDASDDADDEQAEDDTVEEEQKEEATKQDVAEEAAFATAEEREEEADKADDVAADADLPADEEVEEEKGEDEDSGDEILVKYVRKNPTWEQAGHRFTKDHPFKSLPVELAERLIKSGVVVQALPSEVKDYYS